MRVLPQRWFLPVWFLVIVGVIAGVSAVRFGWSPLVVLLSAVGGALLGGAVMLGMAGHDTRLLVLRERHPAAVVVQARRDDSVVTPLSVLAAESSTGLNLGARITLVFDANGLGFWTGGRQPEQFAVLPWDRVDAVGLGEMYVGKSRSDPSHARLRLVVLDEYAHPVTLQFGIHEFEKPWREGFATEDELLAIVEKVHAIRGVTPAPRAARSYIGGGLEPGPTAYAAERIVGIPITALAYLSVLPLAIAMIVTRFDLDAIAFGLLLAWTVVSTLAFLLLLRRQGQATKREAAAGYTTLNGTFLALEQRHPVTGAVIRSAGERALSKQEFAELVR